jgi:hypothetical protein
MNAGGNCERIRKKWKNNDVWCYCNFICTFSIVWNTDTIYCTVKREMYIVRIQAFKYTNIVLAEKLH